MAEENTAHAFAHSIRRMFMSAAVSTKRVNGDIPAIEMADAIVEAIDTIDPIDLPLSQERALLRCRAIAATMPMLPHDDKEQTHLALLAESGAICASEYLRLVGDGGSSAQRVNWTTRLKRRSVLIVGRMRPWSSLRRDV
jgi:hypothetical protein